MYFKNINFDINSHNASIEKIKQLYYDTYKEIGFKC